ncbi:MAG: Gfo/Idh/MocA family oxidoreductase [Hyphomicrobiales bacterium]|nr:Gfo/Idh/MocA family oxidoreductase [Hyphomicrobiales bacterium]
MTGIAMLGAGFIGQMHAQSFLSAAMSRGSDRVNPELDVLIELPQNSDLAREVAGRYGFRQVVLDGWADTLARDGIDLFVNAGPNSAHLAPTVAAADAGKHVFCEKPLARTADEAYRLWKAVDASGVTHMCAFLHRFVPALRHARNMVHAGELGEILHYRSQFLLDMHEPDGSLSWRFSRADAGGGATGDLGSHHIDVARFIVGEVEEVCASTRTWLKNPDGSADNINDDSFSAIGRLDNGALATIEASRVPAGHALTGRIEIDGTKGTLAFSMLRMNELVFTEPGKGPRTIAITLGTHPYGRFFLPVGIQGAHSIGWRDCFVFQAHHMLQAIEHGAPVGPDGATFEDGYRVAEVVDTILRAAESRAFEKVTYRS